jgi:hypothetical protein
MALRIYYQEDAFDKLLSALVLTVRTAKATGAFNRDFVAGVIAMAQGQCLNYGLSWDALIEQAAAAVGFDLVQWIG